MANFCELCGTRLDPETGICPGCGNTANAVVKEAVTEKAEEIAAEVPELEKTVALNAGKTAENVREEIPETPVAPVIPEAPEAPVVPDAPATSFPKFCEKCGSPTDPATGKCPACSARENANTGYVPTYVPVAPVPPSVPKQPKEKKKKSAGGTVGVVLLFVLFVVLFLALISLLIVRNTLSEKNIGVTVDSISCKDVISMFDSETQSFCDNINNSIASINSQISRDYYGYYGGAIDAHLDQKSLAEFGDKSTLKSLVKDKLSQFVEDFLEDGDASVELTRSEIRSFFERNKKLINDKFGIEVDRSIPDSNGSYVEMSDLMTDWIIEKGSNSQVLFDTEEYTEDYETGVNLGKFFLSIASIIILSVLCLIIAVLMFIFRPSLSAICIGIYFIILGLPLTVAGFCGLVFPNMFSSMFDNVLIGSVVASALKVNLLIGVILLAVGVVLIVVRGLIRKFIRKRRAAAAV